MQFWKCFFSSKKQMVHIHLIWFCSTVLADHGIHFNNFSKYHICFIIVFPFLCDILHEKINIFFFFQKSISKYEELNSAKWIWRTSIQTFFYIPPSQFGLECMDCIPYRRVKSHPHKKGCTIYDTKPHMVVKHQFWRSEELWSTSSLLLCPGPLCPSVVIFVSVPSMRQIDLFDNY